MNWLYWIRASLLEPTHWAHEFLVEIKAFGCCVKDVVHALAVRQSMQGPFCQAVHNIYDI